MKKSFIALSIILIIGLFTGCTAKSEFSFIGTIKTIEGQNAIVTAEEGEILKSGREVSVNLSSANDIDLKVGDKIKVYYDGDVRESSPLGINTLSIEIVE